jgi:hypothetical protein
MMTPTTVCNYREGSERELLPVTNSFYFVPTVHDVEIDRGSLLYYLALNNMVSVHCPSEGLLPNPIELQYRYVLSIHNSVNGASCVF